MFQSLTGLSSKVLSFLRALAVIGKIASRIEPDPFGPTQITSRIGQIRSGIRQIRSGIRATSVVFLATSSRSHEFLHEPLRVSFRIGQIPHRIAGDRDGFLRSSVILLQILEGSDLFTTKTQRN